MSVANRVPPEIWLDIFDTLVNSYLLDKNTSPSDFRELVFGRSLYPFSNCIQLGVNAVRRLQLVCRAWKGLGGSYVRHRKGVIPTIETGDPASDLSFKQWHGPGRQRGTGLILPDWFIRQQSTLRSLSSMSNASNSALLRVTMLELTWISKDSSSPDAFPYDLICAAFPTLSTLILGGHSDFELSAPFRLRLPCLITLSITFRIRRRNDRKLPSFGQSQLPSLKHLSISLSDHEENRFEEGAELTETWWSPKVLRPISKQLEILHITAVRARLWDVDLINDFPKLREVILNGLDPLISTFTTRLQAGGIRHITLTLFGTQHPFQPASVYAYTNAIKSLDAATKTSRFRGTIRFKHMTWDHVIEDFEQKGKIKRLGDNWSWRDDMNHFDANGVPWETWRRKATPWKELQAQCEQKAEEKRMRLAGYHLLMAPATPPSRFSFRWPFFNRKNKV